MWVRRWMEEAARDLRYAIRMLAKAPGFAAVAVLTLALGIGANTAVFSIINGALLRPLPYKDPGRLAVVWDKGIGESGLAKIFDSYHDFEAWQKYSHSFEEIAAATWATGSSVLTGRGPARQVLAMPVSAGFFSLLGIQAALGRTFTPEDMHHGCALVLSNNFWRDTLGGEPDITGKNLTLNKRACTVIGVAPPGFFFYPSAVSMWTLITPDFIVPSDKLLVGVFGRLKRGVTRAQAQAELTSIHTALHRSDGLERTIAPVVYDLQGEFTWLAGRNLRTTLWVLLAAVGLVLFIACLNVANLLLGRSFAREREMAVRIALGSGQGRLIRQLLMEGLLLSTGGAAIGVLVAFAAVRYFRSANPIELPVGANINISMPVLAFTLALAVAIALLFGLAPAWSATGVDINNVLKTAGRGPVSSGHRQSLAKALLISEMAMSVVLLVGAGLLMESVLKMGSTPLGFDPNNVIATNLTLPPDRYASPARRATFYDELNRRLRALPGVLGVSIATRRGGTQAIEVQGRAPVTPATEIHDVNERQISQDYFQVLRIPLRKGRVFEKRDRQDSEPVTIVNEALVKRYFPNEDPIGKRVRLFDPHEAKPWLTIVGVVSNEKQATVYHEMSWIEPCMLFRPIAQDAPGSAAVEVRAAGEPGSVSVAIQHEITAMDSDVPANGTEMLEETISKNLSYPRFRAIVFSAFAIFALLLAAIGLHGILQQFVTQRTQEIGVRMAIGAQGRDILRLVARQGGLPVIGGLLIGVLAAIALSRYLASLLYGVRPGDPVTFAAVALTLLATAALAITIPARRAARVDPMIALRYE